MTHTFNPAGGCIAVGPMPEIFSRHILVLNSHKDSCGQPFWKIEWVIRKMLVHVCSSFVGQKAVQKHSFS
jgi:hypothetical protein